MAASLDEIVRAFNRLDRRPAVFDRRLRAGVGLWTPPQPVPVDEIVAAFADHGGFTPDGRRLLLPLHEPSTAKLTGEYLIYRPNQPVPCVSYYDFATDGLEPITYEEFGETYPAWRLRFWHPAFDPPRHPSDVATDADAGTQIERRDAGGRGGAADGASGSAAVAVSSDDTPDPADTEPTGEGSAHVRAVEDRGGPLEVDGNPPFESLRSTVQRQREADRQAARTAFQRLDIDQYAAQAGAIPDLIPAGMDVDAYGQQTVHLQLPDEVDDRGSPDGGRAVGDSGLIDGDGAIDVSERYGIRPEMEVLVDVHSDRAGFPIEAEVLDVEGRQLKLSVYWTRSGGAGRPETAFETESGERFVLAELLDPVPTDRQLAAIDAVEADDRKAGLITGDTEPTYADDPETTVPGAGLNDDQYRAARRALAAEEVHCIHGPPATGSRRTVVQIVKAAAEAGLRVLACAASDRAVDDLLLGESTPDRTDPRSLHGLAEAGALTVARAEAGADSTELARTYANESVWTADVVCTSTGGAHRFGSDAFDLAVVHEATRATVPSSLPAFAAAERTVLAGDHRQLPPVTASETDEREAIEVSLFEHLVASHGDDIVTPLGIQYRMHRAIAAFPNAAFYGGQLRCGERNRDWTIASLAPLAAVHVDGEERQTPSGSYRNDAEAKAVGRQVSQLLHAGVSPEDVGVVTAYSGQIGAVRQRLLDLHDRAVADGVTVGTIEAFQGTEREAIVVSFVRSNPDGDSGYLTFPREGPRRLNVALTRAKRRCVLVGDFETLGARSQHHGPDDTCADLYRRLHRHLRDAGAMEEPSW